MSRIRFFAAAIVTASGLIALPGLAEAHHTTVSCQSPGVWLIVNSENLSMTYTTDQGHSGSIGPNTPAPGDGSTTVAYSGTSLTVSGVWSNGVTNTNTGIGDCTSTTTTTEATTSSTTTTTTLPSTTTSSTPSSTSTSTTEPISSSTSTTLVDSSSTTALTTTSTVASSVPSTTAPPPSSEPTVPPTSPTTTSDPLSTTTSAPTPCITVPPSSTPTDPGTSLPGTPSAPPCGNLPATGVSSPLLIGVAAWLTALGGILVCVVGRRRWNDGR